MKLIKPAEISAKIMTLIDEAEKELIIISPYNKISGWTKLINRIKKAQAKGVSISWYSRKNDIKESNIEEVKSNLGITPVLVNDLHAKIYLNENYAVITSMNMSKTSDDKSIDIGYITECKEEYDEIYSVFKKYIKLKNVDNVQKAHKVESSKRIFSIKEVIHSINSNKYYINSIHKHILNNYGFSKYNYEKENKLEYFNFLTTGCTIQFLLYSQSIRIHIHFPSKKPVRNIFEAICQDRAVNNLSRMGELECFDDEADNYIKYYFELFYKKVDDWQEEELSKFLKDLDFLLKMVISKV